MRFTLSIMQSTEVLKDITKSQRLNIQDYTKRRIVNDFVKQLEMLILSSDDCLVHSAETEDGIIEKKYEIVVLTPVEYLDMYRDCQHSISSGLPFISV